MKKTIELLIQIFRFAVVGGIAFIIDYSILFVLTDIVGMFYLISAAVAFIISTIFNYIFSMRWVFKGKQNINKKKELFIFISLCSIGLLINQIVLFLLVEKISVYYMYAKVIATLIVMIWNFVTRKLFLE